MYNPNDILKLHGGQLVTVIEQKEDGFLVELEKLHSCITHLRTIQVSDVAEIIHSSTIDNK